MEFVGLSQDKYGHVAPLYQLNGRFYRENPGKNPLSTFKRFFGIPKSVMLKDVEAGYDLKHYDLAKKDFLESKKIEDMGIVEETHVMLFQPSMPFWPKLEAAFEKYKIYPNQLGKVPNVAGFLQSGQKIQYDATFSYYQLYLINKIIKDSHTIASLIQKGAKMVKGWGETKEVKEILSLAESIDKDDKAKEFSNYGIDDIAIKFVKHPYEPTLILEVDGLGSFYVIGGRPKTNPEEPIVDIYEKPSIDSKENMLVGLLSKIQRLTNVYSQTYAGVQFYPKGEWIAKLKIIMSFDSTFKPSDPKEQEVVGSLTSAYSLKYFDGIIHMIRDLEEILKRSPDDVTIRFNTNSPMVVEVAEYGKFLLAPRVEEN